MTWQPGTPRRAAERARTALLGDPGRSDATVASAVAVSATTVAKARRGLVAAGLITDVPVPGRARRPYPWQLSATGLAVLQGAQTPREVAELARCSPQAAWKALKRQRHWPDDAAAARDRLDVLVHEPCERCGALFAPLPATAGGPRKRYCSRRCQDAAHGARLRARDRDFRAVAADWPDPQEELPGIPAAVLLSGLCVQPGMKPYWTSDSEQDRQHARRVCLACPVRLPWCHDWALDLGSAAGDVILAGLDAADCRRARRTGWR